MQVKNRAGETIISNHGSKMWIKEYFSNKNITVEFENGFIVYSQLYNNFKVGQIKSPKCLTVCNRCCYVCNDWLSFKNFKKWHDLNFYQLNDFKMHLDKDILVKGNKIYSPQTCVFVPQFINSLFLNCKNKRGKYLIGVTFNKKNKKFISRCEDDNIRMYLGSFDTEIDAFTKYKEYKENHINKYKNKIPETLYKTMINYKVELTD